MELWEALSAKEDDLDPVGYAVKDSIRRIIRPWVSEFLIFFLTEDVS